MLPGKIRLVAFVSSNSENISCCDIPRFYQILGKFFAFVLLVMIEISQGFKTF
jgi:hypothetical protein